MNQECVQGSVSFTLCPPSVALRSSAHFIDKCYSYHYYVHQTDFSILTWFQTGSAQSLVAGGKFASAKIRHLFQNLNTDSDLNPNPNPNPK